MVVGHDPGVGVAVGVAVGVLVGVAVGVAVGVFVGVAVGVFVGVGVATTQLMVYISSDHLASEPPSPPASSEIVIVQVPFGFSPMKAPIASSGTSGEAVVRLTKTWSVITPLLLVYGTGPPGFASSSHTVPLKTLSKLLPLSVVSVTIVPAGDVRVISRSDANVCVRLVVIFRSVR